MTQQADPTRSEASNHPTGMRVVGMDPSLRNWGIASGILDMYSGILELDSLSVTQAVLPKGKQFRQNSLDLESAQQLYRHALAAAKDAHAVFVEVPHGSQSARSMASYGICVGVLGALKASGIPIFELSANEVKLASVGKKTASKEEMIAWATQAHPEADWATYTRGGETLISEAVAEHQADAVAAIHAGVHHPQFQQLLSLMKARL